MQLYHIARNDGEHERDLLRPVIVHGISDPDPNIRNLARWLRDFLDDRRERGIPTGGIYS